MPLDERRAEVNDPVDSGPQMYSNPYCQAQSQFKEKRGGRVLVGWVNID
jgi:hypothetical protein